jgi:hypothetical protein
MIAFAVSCLAAGILMLTAAGCDPVVSIAGADFPGGRPAVCHRSASIPGRARSGRGVSRAY